MHMYIHVQYDEVVRKRKREVRTYSVIHVHVQGIKDKDTCTVHANTMLL